MTSKPVELSLEEIKEQLAFYHRLYYLKRKEDPIYAEKKRETARRHRKKKAMEKLQQDTPDREDKTSETETATEEEEEVKIGRPPTYKTGELKILSVK